YQVHPFQESPQAIDPPRESLFLVSFPAIERVAPELSRLAEVIWRYPGLDGRTASLVQEKEVRPGPEIRAVVSDEDRNVANQVDAFFGTFLAKGLHLGLEDVLDELVVADARAELISPTGQCACLPRDHLPLPLIPGLASLGLLERHEQRVVIKPAGTGREELLVIRVIEGKGLKRPAKQVFLGSSGSDEIDLIGRKGRQIVQVRRAQPPP